MKPNQSLKLFFIFIFSFVHLHPSLAQSEKQNIYRTHVELYGDATHHTKFGLKEHLDLSKFLALAVLVEYALLQNLPITWLRVNYDSSGHSNYRKHRSFQSFEIIAYALLIFASSIQLSYILLNVLYFGSKYHFEKQRNGQAALPFAEMADILDAVPGILGPGREDEKSQRALEKFLSPINQTKANLNLPILSVEDFKEILLQLSQIGSFNRAIHPSKIKQQIANGNIEKFLALAAKKPLEFNLFDLSEAYSLQAQAPTNADFPIDQMDKTYRYASRGGNRTAAETAAHLPAFQNIQNILIAFLEKEIHLSPTKTTILEESNQVTECYLCLEEHPVLKCKNCENEICQKCLKGCFNAQMRKNTITHCESCQVPFDTGFLKNLFLMNSELRSEKDRGRHLLSHMSDVLEKIYVNHLRKILKLEQNALTCPVNYCEGMMVLKNADQKNFACPVCQNNSCLACGALHSYGDGNCRGSRIDTSEEGLQRCSNCRVPVVKDGGCSSLTCPLCETVFTI